MKRKIAGLMIILLVFSLFGCSKKEESTALPGQDKPPVSEQPTLEAVDLTAALTAQAVEGKEIDAAFLAGQMGFSLKLLQQVAAEKGAEDLLLSPLSVVLALAMTANGANGATAEEMLAVLGGYTEEELNGYLYQWLQNLPSSERAKFSVANSIWYRDGFTVKGDFLQQTLNYYGADFYQAPFDDTTVADINRWVGEETDGMIPKLLEQINAETMVYLINALAFDAQWADIYYDHMIREASFHAADGTEQTAQMMYSQETTYLEHGNAVGFMKYYAGAYSFAALMPQEGESLAEFLEGLTAESLSACFENGTYCTVNAGLPQFTNDFDLSLNEVLKAMGMPTAFGNADFGRMSNAGLAISEVLHKTYIEVNEIGTRAAAVTSVAMDESAAVMPDEVRDVILDRPFVYFILDARTNLPIFIGTVASV
ncbi:MAG: serpin family protein [Clostridia bacterium]|nr:serpin family protein [Clostridia bacterium]